LTVKKKKKWRVYLAGAMQYAPDMGAGWRNKLQKSLRKLPFEFRDPVKLEPKKLKGKRVNRLPEGVNSWFEFKASNVERLLQRFDLYGNKIMLADLIEVLKCDAIIVYRDEHTRTSGTHAEVTFARIFDIPVLCICKDYNKLESWFLWAVSRFGNGRLFETFKELEAFMKKDLCKLIAKSKKSPLHKEKEAIRKDMIKTLKKEFKTL